MVAVRVALKAPAPAAADALPVLAQREIILRAGFILAVHEQIKIHGQALRVQAVTDALTRSGVQLCLFRRAVRFTKGQAQPFSCAKLISCAIM